MPSLQEAMAAQTAAYNALYSKVNTEIVDIETAVQDAIDTLDSNWTTKDGEIDVEIAAKMAEVDAKLADIDTTTRYAAPAALGAGDGLTSATATTLADLIQNHLLNNVINIIKLAPGQHVLTGAIGGELSDYFLLWFNHDDTYGAFDSGNVATHPIICTEHTVDADISESLVGNPNLSQSCQAHAHDEIPLVFHNCGFGFVNVYLRGTRGCLKADEGSTWFTSFQNILSTNTWVYNITCPSHTGWGIWLHDCNIVGLGQDIEATIWHPDYTQCADTIIDYVSPLIISGTTRGINRGTVTVNGYNIPTAEYPSQLTEGFRTDVATSMKSAINVIGADAYFEIDKLISNGLRQLFYVTGKLKVNYIELVSDSQPPQWIGQVHGSNAQLLLTNEGGDWLADTDPKTFKIQNVNNDPDQASLLAWDGAKLHMNDVAITSTDCACSTLITTDGKADVLLKDSVVTAYDRAGNQGFRQILNSANTEARVEGCTLETRQGDDDTAIITIDAGKTVSKGNTSTTSTEHSEASYGRYLDSNGVISGGHSITEDITINVPADFATEQEAFDYLNDKTWSADVNVVIQTAGGLHTSTIVNTHSLPITLKGAASFEKTVSALGTVSGSAGDWTADITLNNVDDIEVGHHVLILETTGTGMHHAHRGVKKVTAINSLTITVTNTNQNAAFPASTLTGGRVIVIPTAISRENAGGILVNEGQHLILEDIVLTGNRSVDTMIGVISRQGTYIELKNFGVIDVAGSYGIWVGDSSSSSMENVCVENCYAGIFIRSSSSMQLKAGSLVASGNRAFGYVVTGMSNVESHYAHGMTICVGNDIGLDVTSGAISLATSFVGGNITTDYLAKNNGFITLNGQGYASSTFSPAKNVEGNNGAWII